MGQNEIFAISSIGNFLEGYAERLRLGLGDAKQNQSWHLAQEARAIASVNAARVLRKHLNLCIEPA